MQAVTRNELYGYVHPSTREWREGLISTTFRDMSNNKTNKHQWILLDGDIDAEWIEVSRDYDLVCPYFMFPFCFIGRHKRAADSRACYF